MRFIVISFYIENAIWKQGHACKELSNDVLMLQKLVLFILTALSAITIP